MASKLDIKIKQYENTVVEFIKKGSGLFLVASADSLFLSVLRNTINKQLAIDDDCISQITNPNNILKAVKDSTTRKKTILLFIEQVLNNQETGFLVKQIKNAFSSVKVIILTGEAERQRLVLLHEIGADNFISKPISINTLIEKIAFTIKPQGKIGKLIDQGKRLNEQGAYEQSLKLARAILDIKPNSAAGYLVMGDAFRGLGKDDKAIESFQKASSHAQLYLDPLKKLAEFFEEKGDMEQQLHYLEKLDKLSPLNVERKVDMGEIHVGLGNHDQAEVLFDGAIAQAQKEAISYIEEISTKIGNIYNKSNPEKAAKYYRKALASKGNLLDRSDIKTFNLLGIALRKQGKWREAISEYRKAYKISPDDENLMYNIAMAFAEGGDYRNAAENAENALAINPEFWAKDPVLAYNLGLIFHKANDRKYARKFLEQALKLRPDFESPKKLLATY